MGADENPAADWIARNAISLTSVNATEGFEDLLPLIPLLESARIIAIGEGTHGTREFFTVRHRLIELLVAELGVRVFAFEFPYGEGLEINEYIRTGQGDPYEILSRVYCPPWNHQEMIDLIEWMRSFNASRETSDLVQFHGIDIHDGSSTLISESILHYVSAVEPARVAEFAEVLDCFRYTSMYDAILIAADRSGSCLGKLEWVAEEIAGEREAWEARSSHAACDAALHEAELLVQRAEIFTAAARGQLEADNLRDRYLAENLTWLIDSLDGGEEVQVAFSAHSYHVGRYRLPLASPLQGMRVSMGWHLNEAFGPAYAILGMIAGAGEVAVFPRPGSSRVSDEEGYGPLQHEVVDLPWLPAGRIADAFRSSGLSICAVDVRGSEKDADAEWLWETRPLLQIGTSFAPHSFSSYAVKIAVPRAFDLLLYIEETTAPTILPWRPADSLEP